MAGYGLPPLSGLSGAEAYTAESLDALLQQRLQQALAERAFQEQVRQFNVGAGERTRQHLADEAERLRVHDFAQKQAQDVLNATKQQRTDLQAQNFYTHAQPTEDIGPVMAGHLRTLGIPIGSVPGSNPNPQAMPAGVLTTGGGAVPPLPGGLEAPPPFRPETFPLPQGGSLAQAASAAATERATQAGEAERIRAQNAKDLANLHAQHQEALARVVAGLKQAPEHGRIVVQGPDGPLWADPRNPSAPAVPILGPGAGAEGPTPLKAKPNATIATRLSLAKASLQTGQDVVNSLSDPTIQASLGPLKGRYTTIKEFLGNPPPEFHELAGNIESFAMSLPGIHGQRNREQVRELRDQMLNAKFSPAALASGIKGLNNFSRHLLENEGLEVPTSPGAKATAPPPDDAYQRYLKR